MLIFNCIATMYTLSFLDFLQEEPCCQSLGEVFFMMVFCKFFIYKKVKNEEEEKKKRKTKTEKSSA